MPIRALAETETGMAEYIPTIISECLRIVVCTRNRNFDNDQYEQGVVQPYNRIQKMQEQMEKEGKEASKEQMAEALAMLKTVFKTKMVPLDEQLERFEEVFSKSGRRQEEFPEFNLPTQADITWQDEQ